MIQALKAARPVALFAGFMIDLKSYTTASSYSRLSLPKRKEKWNSGQQCNRTAFAWTSNKYQAIPVSMIRQASLEMYHQHQHEVTFAVSRLWLPRCLLLAAALCKTATSAKMPNPECSANKQAATGGDKKYSAQQQSFSVSSLKSYLTCLANNVCSVWMGGVHIYVRCDGWGGWRLEQACVLLQNRHCKWIAGHTFRKRFL